jgi:hypothetical protein
MVGVGKYTLVIALLAVADVNGIQQFSPEDRYLGSWAGAAGMLADGLAFGATPGTALTTTVTITNAASVTANFR